MSKQTKAEEPATDSKEEMAPSHDSAPDSSSESQPPESRASDKPSSQLGPKRGSKSQSLTKTTSRGRALASALVQPIEERLIKKANNPEEHPEHSHFNTNELREFFQSPERGVFLMHQRSRQRIFLARVGLNRMSPTPETPVVRMERDAFLEYLREEDPELSHSLRGKELPEEVLILEQLPLRQLRKTSIPNVLWRYWTWQVVGDLMGQWRQLDVDATELRVLIGHTAFEEVRSHMIRGRFLFDADDDNELVEHFVSWWGMYTHFAPEYRNDVYPSIPVEQMDEWLREKGLDIKQAVERQRPNIDLPIPTQLEQDAPKPWLRWALVDHVVEEPVSEISSVKKLLRQPNWGALIFLLLIIATCTGLFYLLQASGVARVKEAMFFIEEVTGIHHLMVAPYRPSTIGLFIGMGYLLLLAAHLLDVGWMGTLTEQLTRSPNWLDGTEKDERKAARKACRATSRMLWRNLDHNEHVPSGRPAIAEMTEAIIVGIFEWARMFLWGGLLWALPSRGFSMPWLAKWIARAELNQQVFLFGYSLKRALHERRCGNDANAILRTLKAISCYQNIQEVQNEQQELQDDEVGEKLADMRDVLTARVHKQFGGYPPAFIAPSSGSFLSIFAVLLFLWVTALSIQGYVYFALWGYLLYSLSAHFLDVTASIRREVHFWKEPAWRRYLLPLELKEGREICMAHAQELWQQRDRASFSQKQRALFFEVLSMVTGMLRWWAKVRLWGHLITAFLFQWGKFVPLLRFAAHQILRKQIFEFAYHLEWALHARQRGNEAEAALQLTEAIAFYHPFVPAGQEDLLLDQLLLERNKLCGEIRDRFVEAHQLEDLAEMDSLDELIVELIDVPLSTALGRQCAAVLKTLQRSYLDKDRKFFLTQIGNWAKSLGKQPLQMGLDHYGLVRSLHYLQATQKKMSILPLSEKQIARWLKPLDSAHDYLESRIREVFGPKILEAMEEAGFHALNSREAVAQAKIRDELLDLVMVRGRFSFSDVRDVISRNEMRLHDPSWRELALGDKMLRLDHSFEERFHEIYRESEIYLRWLQRFSSLLFGTMIGRWLCRYIIIPFGGAAIILVFAGYLGGIFYKLFLKTKSQPSFASLPLISMLGVVILLIIHTETGRVIFRQLLNGIGNGFRFLFMEAPRWVIQRPFIQEALKHPRALYFYRQFALPLGMASVLFGIESGVLLLFARDLMQWQFLLPLFVLSTLCTYGFLNTQLGRALLDRFVYRWLYIWHQIKDRWVIGLLRMIMDFFQAMLLRLDYIIYRGDDILRFHKGEGQHVIFVKAIGQMVWSSFTYIFRMMINLIVEPQVNPVKHFPVVTVSHKVVSTLMGGVIVFLASRGWTSPILIGAVIITFQFFIPGICGFLVWEFKENWKLFRSNQPQELQPIRIGPHGETMESLLRRGFHSGTVPKTYDKLDSYANTEFLYIDKAKRRRLHEHLHHVSDALEEFVERELLEAFRQRAFVRERFPIQGKKHPSLGINHIDLLFWIAPQDRVDQRYLWRLRIELEGKWLLGSVHALEEPTDTACALTQEERKQLDEDMVLVLQKSGVRIMRSKLETQLSFYLRSFSVGVPGAPKGDMRAEYRVKKEEVRVDITSPKSETQTIIYQLDEEARLREPAPLVALENGDQILPT